MWKALVADVDEQGWLGYNRLVINSFLLASLICRARDQRKECSFA